MCTGGRLLADFVAGTDTKPDLPHMLEQHLTTTTNGLWLVWAYKLARQEGDLYVPLTGGPGYPADAKAQCRARRIRAGHRAPQPDCTCGFHALSRHARDDMLRYYAARGLDRNITALTVALSGRVLAFDWPGGVLWRAERQTVVRVEPSAPPRAEPRDRRRILSYDVSVIRRYPDDPAGRRALVHPAQPRDSGPVRLDLPVTCPVLPVRHDDAGWCMVSSIDEPTSATLLSELMARVALDAEQVRTRSTRPTRNHAAIEDAHDVAGRDRQPAKIA